MKRKADVGDSVNESSIKQPRAMEAHVIDEDLHSRQLAVYGRDCMRRLARSRVLISGVNGLGAEIGAPSQP